MTIKIKAALQITILLVATIAFAVLISPTAFAATAACTQDQISQRNDVTQRDSLNGQTCKCTNCNIGGTTVNGDITFGPSGTYSVRGQGSVGSTNVANIENVRVSGTNLEGKCSPGKSCNVAGIPISGSCDKGFSYNTATKVLTPKCGTVDLSGPNTPKDVTVMGGGAANVKLPGGVTATGYSSIKADGNGGYDIQGDNTIVKGKTPTNEDYTLSLDRGSVHVYPGGSIEGRPPAGGGGERFIADYQIGPNKNDKVRVSSDRPTIINSANPENLALTCLPLDKSRNCVSITPKTDGRRKMQMSGAGLTVVTYSNDGTSNFITDVEAYPTSEASPLKLVEQDSTLGIISHTFGPGSDITNKEIYSCQKSSSPDSCKEFSYLETLGLYDPTHLNDGKYSGYFYSQDSLTDLPPDQQAERGFYPAQKNADGTCPPAGKGSATSFIGKGMDLITGKLLLGLAILAVCVLIGAYLLVSWAKRQSLPQAYGSESYGTATPAQPAPAPPKNKACCNNCLDPNNAQRPYDWDEAVTSCNDKCKGEGDCNKIYTGE